tara:strand:- start:132 stop:647 length:516 start_codon:yes stop_codon:yes gene_type:complete
MKISELSSNEYNPYFKTYFDKVNDLSLLDSIAEGKFETINFFKGIPKSKLDYRYEESKWTIKEILIHIIDTERVFNYRALQFARSENANLEGFDENEFVRNTDLNIRTIDSILEEYSIVRDASIVLFKNFSEDTLKRTGKVNNTSLSVRAAGFLICGHETHHIQVIEERYL